MSPNPKVANTVTTSLKPGSREIENATFFTVVLTLHNEWFTRYQVYVRKRISRDLSKSVVIGPRAYVSIASILLASW